MSGIHSTGRARRGLQVRVGRVGRTNNGESYEKSVANGQAAKKSALPLAFKSRYAMPSRLGRGLRRRGQNQNGLSDKDRDGLRTIALEELLGPVAVLSNKIQQRVTRDMSEKPNRNSGTASVVKPKHSRTRWWLKNLNNND
jgi:hypothetical protein